MSLDRSEVFALVEKMHSDFKLTGTYIKIHSSGTIILGDEKINQKNCLSFLREMAQLSPEYVPLVMEDSNTFLNAFRIVHSQDLKKIVGDFSVEINSYNYQGLIPFQSITDATKYVMFDTTNGMVTDLDFKTYRESKDATVREPIRGRIEFNPYHPEPLTHRNDFYGRPCNFLNTYKKPAWQERKQLSKEEIGQYAFPQLFIDFMLHLFPTKECRTFVLDWLHFALTDRCETYLVLNGAKGIGKNLFSEMLCKPLMGDNNHKVAQPSALTSDFNALLRDSRMIVMDEFRIDTPEKINKLKRYVNEEQMIERKGVDVDSTTKTYNSFIISNNDQADMKISWDDRRFSVADMTSKKINEAWSKEKMASFVDMCSDMDAIKNIGYCLMYRQPTHSKFDAYKGSHFYALCYSSFSEWQRIIVDLACTRHYREITNSELRKEYRRRTETNKLPGTARIKDFVQNYRHDGLHSLGDFVKRANDVWVIELSEEFRSQEGLTLLQDGDDLLS